MEFTTHLELHSQTTRLFEGTLHRSGTSHRTGFSPSVTFCSKKHRQEPDPKIPSSNYNSDTESARFQIWAFAASLAATKAIPVGFFWSLYQWVEKTYPLVYTPPFFQANPAYRSTPNPRVWGRNDAQTGMPFGIPKGAMCVQRFDDSRISAIHITYRISLRSSSMREPRDPLLKVLTIK